MTGCLLIAWLTVAFSVPVYSCKQKNGYAEGYVYGPHNAFIEIWRQHVVHLRPGMPWVGKKAAVAVYVLGHEIGHLRASDDPYMVASECEADIWARGHWNQIVKKLGGSYEDAQKLWENFNLTDWRATRCP